MINKKAELLEKDFKKLFPDIRFKQEFKCCGTFGKTKEALPYIGKYKEAYYALGFGGNGITFSVLAAQILTDLIMKKLNINTELFSFER